MYPRPSTSYITSVLNVFLTVSVLLSLLPLTTRAEIITPATKQPLTAAFTTTASCSNTTALKAIPTYESMGLYLSAGAGATQVRYRQQGQGTWKEGLPLWDDGRTFTPVTSNNNGSRHRGSLVHLNPNTSYEVQVLRGNILHCGTFRTLNDNFPVGEVVQIGNRTTPLMITQGGTASAYKVYEGGSITVPMSAEAAITVNANYVIIRNTKISGPRQGIVIGDNHDIVIENSEITNWGKFIDRSGSDTDRARYGLASKDWGDSDGGIQIGTNAYRITIQKNYIHIPRTDSNTWKEQNTFRYGCQNSGDNCHPTGPRAINWSGSNQGIQRIIRYNTMVGTRTNMFEDVISGSTNDTDVYGNFFSGFVDDTMEIDGVSRNVRVWGNRTHIISPDNESVNDYLVNQSGSQWRQPAVYSVSPIDVGPVFVWRNLVTGNPNTLVAMTVKKQSKPDRRSRTVPVEVEYGRLYFLNNTSYSGTISGSSFPIANVLAYNNIQPGGIQSSQVDSDFKFNLTGNSALSTLDSNFIVKPNTGGYNKGTFIPNFTDSYAGSAPDMGYQEASGQPLKVGHTGSPLLVTGGGSGATGTTIPVTTTGGGTIPLTPCGNFSSPTTPTGYGSAYNHFSGERERIVEAGCDDQGFAPFTGSYSTNNTNFAVFQTGYYWTGTKWQPYTLRPTSGLGQASTKNPGWILGPGAASRIPYQGDTTYFVAYTCHFGPGQAPKCGCADATCATPKWQLQAVTRVAR